MAQTQKRWRDKASKKKVKMKNKLDHSCFENDEEMTMRLVPGRPRIGIETTRRKRMLAAAMTKMAQPYAETDQRRRAEENVINQTVRGFALEVNEYICECSHLFQQ